MSKHQLNKFRRIFVYDFNYEESKCLEDLVGRVGGKFDFEKVEDFREVVEYLHRKGMVGNWNRMVVIRSSVVYPPMIYFLILHNSDTGGRLFLLETNESWYSHEKVLLSMRSFSRIAGIICRYVGTMLV